MTDGGQNNLGPNFDPKNDYLEDFEDKDEIIEDELIDDDDYDEDNSDLEQDEIKKQLKEARENKKSNNQTEKEKKGENKETDKSDTNSEGNSEQEGEGPETGEAGGESGELGELGTEGGEFASEAGELGELAELGEVAEGVEALEVAGTATAEVAEGGGVIAFLVSNPIGWAILIIIAIIIVFVLVGFFVSGIVGLVGGGIIPGAGGGTTPPVTTPGTTATICLDPGHPSEVGAGAPGEMELNYKVATELKSALTTKGYTVVITKADQGEYVTNRNRVLRCVAGNADFMYRIHGDSATGKKGPYHIYPDALQTNIYSDSKNYAEIIQKAVTDELGVTGATTGGQPLDGGSCADTPCTGSPLTGSNEANANNLPTALIEMLSLDSAGLAWLNNPTNRTKMVTGMLKGIESIFPISGGGVGGPGPIGLMAKGCDFKDNPTEYKSVKFKGWTDCWGFVSTSLHYSADPDFIPASRAKDGPDNLKSHDNSKHGGIKYLVLPYSSSSLRPGDMLFVTNSGSHAGLYIGSDYCSCGSKTTLQASLNRSNPEVPNPPRAHQPICDKLANRWDTIVRIIN